MKNTIIVMACLLVIFVISGSANSGDVMHNETKQRFVYFYFMNSEVERGESIVPLHVEYWKKLELSQFKGGPFGDFSGGMISFEMESEAKANAAVAGDPFIVHDVIKDKWLKKWLVSE